MSGPATRLYGWDLSALAIYANQAAGVNLSGLTTLGSSDLLSVYTDGRLRIADTDVEGRATWEDWKFPLPIDSEWSVRVGTVVDSTLPMLTYLRTHYGRGPYCVWMKLGSVEWNGRALISEVEWSLGMEAMGETMGLKGQGALIEGHITG